MKFYQHKQTGELMGSLDNLRDLIIGNTVTCVTDVVYPYRWLGNGIISHCTTYEEIRNNYKRISKIKAKKLCKDFGQWRHIDDIGNRTIIRNGQYHLGELLDKREIGFGRPFTELAKKLEEKRVSELPIEFRAEFLKKPEQPDGSIYWATGGKLMEKLNLLKDFEISK